MEALDTIWQEISVILNEFLECSQHSFLLFVRQEIDTHVVRVAIIEHNGIDTFVMNRGYKDPTQITGDLLTKESEDPLTFLRLPLTMESLDKWLFACTTTLATITQLGIILIVLELGNMLVQFPDL